MTITSLPREASAHRLFLVAGLATILAGLTGCTLGAEKPPTPVIAPEATTQAPEEPADAPLFIPGCADLPVAVGLTEGTGFEWEMAEQVGPENYHVYTNAMGPQALAALEAASKSEYCVWVQSGTFGEVWAETLVVELEPATRTGLVESLRGSDYLEGASGETLTFDYELATNGAPIEISYAFLENVWVATFSSPIDGLPELARNLVLEGVRSQNAASGA